MVSEEEEENTLATLRRPGGGGGGPSKRDNTIPVTTRKSPGVESIVLKSFLMLVNLTVGGSSSSFLVDSGEVGKVEAGGGADEADTGGHVVELNSVDTIVESVTLKAWRKSGS